MWPEFTLQSNHFLALVADLAIVSDFFAIFGLEELLGNFGFLGVEFDLEGVSAGDCCIWPWAAGFFLGSLKYPAAPVAFSLACSIVPSSNIAKMFFLIIPVNNLSFTLKCSLTYFWIAALLTPLRLFKDVRASITGSFFFSHEIYNFPKTA